MKALQPVGGQCVGTGVLVDRVSFEMLTICSSPLTAQPLLLRKSNANVFCEDPNSFVTFQSPSAVYK